MTYRPGVREKLEDFAEGNSRRILNLGFTICPLQFTMYWLQKSNSLGGRNQGIATDALHAGERPDPTTGAIITPIYQTSTYVQEEIGKHEGYEYARTQNPARAAGEANIAALEKGTRGIAYASGMAAINAVMTLLKAGDHVIASSNL